MFSKKDYMKSWLIPLAGIIFIILFALFVRFTVGTGTEMEMDYQTPAFVPSESPQSTGEDSR